MNDSMDQLDFAGDKTEDYHNQQDETPGLQVHLNGEWYDVPPVKGAYIVNLGDMLQRWTNDTFRSTLHRVVSQACLLPPPPSPVLMHSSGPFPLSSLLPLSQVNKAGLERYSTPFFYEPNFDTVVCRLDHQLIGQ